MPFTLFYGREYNKMNPWLVVGLTQLWLIRWPRVKGNKRRKLSLKIKLRNDHRSFYRIKRYRKWASLFSMFEKQ